MTIIGEYRGTPSACFLPTKNYRIKDASELAVLTVPVRGVFPDDDDFPYKGEYNLSPEPGVILFTDLLKVLFAERAYPYLKKNQRFVISATEVNENNVNVFGKIVEILED